MSVFNFESAICTSREQSERLLALGLKKETADMSICYVTHDLSGKEIVPLLAEYLCEPMPCEERQTVLFSRQKFIPAWSLGRLIKDLMPQRVGYFELAVGGDYVGYYEDTYDGMEWKYASETPDMFINIISTIEWLIKEGYFNKEYLENGNC